MKKIILASLAASSLVLASENNELVTHTELGYIQTEGNTETKTFTFNGKANKAWGVHAIEIKAGAQYGEDTKVENKNSLFAEATYAYSITERFAADYLAGFKRDKFTAYDNQMYTGPGAKYLAIDLEAHKLNIGANVLYSRDNLRDSPETETYGAYRGALTYNWQITESLKFDQDLSYRGSFEDNENYFVDSKSVLSAKIADNLSAGLSYLVSYINLKGDVEEYADRTLTATLIIDY